MLAQAGAAANGVAAPALNSLDAAVTAPSGAKPPDSKGLEIIKQEHAAYPIAAREKGIQGQVLVRVAVDENGDVVDAEVVSGDPMLTGSALDAAKKFKFKPYIRNGVPVKVDTRLTFNFSFYENTEDIKPKEQKAVTVAQGVMVGMLVHRVQPVYPAEARNAGISGTVVLQAVIGKDGKIESLHAISGPKVFIPSALGAVQQWTYRPYMMNGEAVKVDTQITVNYLLKSF